MSKSCRDPESSDEITLQREEIDGIIEDDEYTAVAKMTDDREVTLTVCVDPTVDPGTYAGSVRVEHSTIQDVTVPIRATLHIRRGGC